MKEKYGAELELITDRFKQKMNQIKSSMSDFASKAKKDFTTGIYIDTDRAEKRLTVLENSLEEAKEKLQSLKDDYKGGFTMSDNTAQKIEEATKNVEELQESINTVKSTIDTINTSPFAMLGQTVKNAKNALASFGSYIKENIGKLDFSNIKKGLTDITSGLARLTGGALKNAINGFQRLKRSTESTTNTIKKSMSKSVNSLKRFAFSLFGIQTAWRAISKAVHSYLSYDSDLQKSIQQTWAGFGSFLAPVLEYLVNLFRQLLTYVNSAVKAFTGIDFVARANAKALDKQAKSAKNASKALAGIDELTNIQQQGGDEPNLIGLSDIDTSGIETFASKLKAMFSEGDFVGIAELFSQKLIEGLQNIRDFIQNINVAPLADALNGIFEGINYAGIYVNLISIFGEAVLKLQQLFLAINWEVLLEGLSKAVIAGFNTMTKYVTMIDFSGIGQKLTEMFISIDWAGIGSSIINLLWEGLKGIVNLFLSIDWSEVGRTVSNAVNSWIRTIIAKFNETDWKQLGKNIVDAIWNFVTSINWFELAENIMKGIADGIGAFISLVVGAFVELWNKILEFFGIHSPSTKGADMGRNIIEGMLNGINAIKNKIITAFQDIWTGIKNVFSSVGTFFKNTFTNAWTSVKNVFSTGGQIFSGIKEGIEKTFKSIVNKLIDGINKVVSTPFNKINDMLNTIRNVNILGAKPFAGLWKQNPIGVPKIPKLAIGTDNVRSEGLAYLHAGEKVVPADVASGGYSGGDNTETNNLLRQLIQTLEDKDFDAYISASEIGKASVNYIRNQNRIMGGSVI